MIWPHTKTYNHCQPQVKNMYDNELIHHQKHNIPKHPNTFQNHTKTIHLGYSTASQHIPAASQTPQKYPNNTPNIYVKTQVYIQEHTQISQKSSGMFWNVLGCFCWGVFGVLLGCFGMFYIQVQTETHTNNFCNNQC